MHLLGIHDQFANIESAFRNADSKRRSPLFMLTFFVLEKELIS